MILRQFRHFEPVAASFLPGCGSKAFAAVIGPVGDHASHLGAAAAARTRNAGIAA